MNLQGLRTYFSVLVTPRRAFERLSSAPAWGWAAVCGLAMTVLAVLIAEKAQLHVLAVIEAHRIAMLPPGEQVRERIAAAQVAPHRHAIFIVGALTTPWIVWFLIASFFFLTAALVRGQTSFAAAWVATLNSYVVYAVAGVLNAALVASRDPGTLSSSLDLVRLPSLGWFFPHSVQLAAFLSAYSVAGIWYYAVVAIALEQVLRMPRAAAVAAAIGLSLFFGFFAAAAGRNGP